VDHHVLGWSQAWDPLLEQEQYELENLARVIARHKHVCEALTTTGEALNLHMAGRLLRGYAAPALNPAVGDWCAFGERFVDESNTVSAVIETLLPRRTSITRAAAGLTSDHQVLAANIDIMFVMTSLNRDLNVNRLRRYVLLAEQGGVRPIFVLSKMDLLFAPGHMDETCMAALNSIEKTFPDVQRIFTSAIDGSGLPEIRSLLHTGITAVFLGSSGVGKSTLVNALLVSMVQKTGEIRPDQRGRHTTSGSELFFMPEGGMIVDTAGLRQVGVVGDEETLERLMPTVSQLAQSCRFKGCLHNSEPGCAVQDALLTGALERGDYDNYLQLSKELAYSRRKADQRLAVEERQRWKQIAVNQRRMKRERKA
jgi:ribosome biogenesis GTPase